ncbi:MAG: hypothetical protein LBO80_03970 [Treponema sp.]|jgi:hypothetical protein|nr:hypothetical protein [Treponema sp.]
MRTKKDKSGAAGCSHILTREIGLLEKITLVQSQVKNAVINREWTGFELFFDTLGKFSAEFEALEKERIGLFADLFPRKDGKDESAGFYAMVSRFPAEERKALTGLYRQLKMETFKIRLANDALLRYIDEARVTVAAFLEAAFPDRKGRLYSRRGTQVPSDMRSMVLNRRL